MRAALCVGSDTRRTVRVAEVPTPQPGPDDVVVRVHAATVTAVDARLARAVRRPDGMVLGSALSGVVEQVGTRVDTFRPGDRVCGTTGAEMGTHAEYAVAPATDLAHLKADVSHDEAAAVLPGGLTALRLLRDEAAFTAGARVLVVGAAASVGSAAVQLARHHGAHVTVIADQHDADRMRWLGADAVLDPTTPRDTPEARFDVVVDTDGEPASGTTADIALLLDLVAAGTIDPMVATGHSLAQVAELLERFDAGGVVGNLVVHP